MIPLRPLTVAALLAVTPLTALAQANGIASQDDWGAYAAGSPKECWAASSPTKTVNTDSDGNAKDVTRGDIWLYVTYRAGKGAEVSFTGGYPFAQGSTVDMTIGGQKFDLFTDGEFAWPAPSADDKIIGAMRAGSNAVLTARSARGTITRDTFSLIGFTAMVNRAKSECQ